MVIASASGTPSAVPLKPAKLDRMSLRTTPLWGNTFGPLEPSPGYGPSVSLGIRLVQVAPPLVVVVVVVVVVVGDVGLLLQPTSCRAPNTPPNRAAIRNSLRRSIASPVASRSRCRPPKSSWSLW